VSQRTVAVKTTLGLRTDKEDMDMQTPDDRYTEHDARVRVLIARLGSLDPDRVTLPYLIELNNELYKWRETVKAAILNWPDSSNL